MEQKNSINAPIVCKYVSGKQGENPEDPEDEFQGIFTLYTFFGLLVYYLNENEGYKR